MFRRAFTSFGRVAGAIGGVQLGAATAVALSDKELKRKPEWYQQQVHSIEEALHRLSKYGFIESPLLLDEAYEVLSKVSDVDHAELQWRIARLLAEKAELSKNADEKKHLLHDAKAFAKKGLALEGAKGSSGAHKWYGIILQRLDALEKTNHADEIFKHFQRAAELDPKDPYAHLLLGIEQYKKKAYADAIASFNKAEGIRSHFSAANLYYLALAQLGAGKKTEAIESFKQTLATHARNRPDGKARSDAKAQLLKLKVKPEEFEYNDDI